MKSTQSLPLGGVLALTVVPAAAQAQQLCVDVEYVFPPPANQDAITAAIDAGFRRVDPDGCVEPVSLRVSEGRGGSISILATESGIEALSDPSETLSSFAERAAREIHGVQAVDTTRSVPTDEPPSSPDASQDDACVWATAEPPAFEQAVVVGALAMELEQRTFDVQFYAPCASARSLRVSGEPGAMVIEATRGDDLSWLEQLPGEDSLDFAQRAVVELFGVVEAPGVARAPRRSARPRHVDESGFTWFPFIGFNLTAPGSAYSYDYDDYEFGYGDSYVGGVITNAYGGAVVPGLSFGVSLRHARPDQIDFQADLGIDGRNVASYSYLIAASRANSVFLSNTLSARFPIAQRREADRHFFMGWRSSVYLFGMYGVQVLGFPGATEFYTDNTFNAAVFGPSLGFQIERRPRRRNLERRRELDIRFNFDLLDTLSDFNVNYGQIELRWRFGR